MQEIICVDFKSGTIPQEWFIEAKNYSFEQNCGRTHDAAWFIIPLPEGVWKKIKVEIAVKALNADNIECSIDDVLSVVVALQDSPYARHTTTKISALH